MTSPSSHIVGASTGDENGIRIHKLTKIEDAKEEILSADDSLDGDFPDVIVAGQKNNSGGSLVEAISMNKALTA